MTSDTLKSIRIFQTNLNELLELCGVEKGDIKFPKPSKLASILEKFSKDDSAVKYFNHLKAQVKEAKKLLEERQLDYWNSEQNEKLLEECQSKLKVCEQEVERLRKKLTGCDVEKVCEQKVIEDLIHMLDQLQDKKTWLSEGGSENELLAKFLDGQIKETMTILERAGVEILEENGVFDKSLQRAVKTVKTDDPQMKNKVAETFRPGFLYDGIVLREQEVVVYVPTEEEDGCH